jgi:hypothetical protein
MNAVTELFIIFCVLTISFFFQLPPTDDINFTKNKTIIFFIVLITTILINLIIKYASNLNCNDPILSKYTIFYALIAIIGYSTYIDLNLNKYTLPYIKKITYGPYSRYMFIAAVITLHISLVKIIHLLFQSNTRTCTSNNSLNNSTNSINTSNISESEN